MLALMHIYQIKLILGLPLKQMLGCRASIWFVSAFPSHNSARVQSPSALTPHGHRAREHWPYVAEQQISRCLSLLL